MSNPIRHHVKLSHSTQSFLILTWLFYKVEQAIQRHYHVNSTKFDTNTKGTKRFCPKLQTCSIMGGGGGGVHQNPQ